MLLIFNCTNCIRVVGLKFLVMSDVGILVWIPHLGIPSGYFRKKVMCGPCHADAKPGRRVFM